MLDEQHEPINPYEEDPEFDYYMRRFRKRRAKTLKASDVPKAAILNWRVRPGVKIFRDPNLMQRFLRIRLVRQPQPVFAAIRSATISPRCMTCKMHGA